MKLEYKQALAGVDSNCGCGASKVKSLAEILQSSSELQIFVQKFMVESSVTIINVEFTDAECKGTSVVVTDKSSTDSQVHCCAQETSNSGLKRANMRRL